MPSTLIRLVISENPYAEILKFVYVYFFIILAIVTTTHRIKPLQGNFLETSILKRYNIDSMKIITMPAIIICLTDGFI